MQPDRVWLVLLSSMVLYLNDAHANEEITVSLPGGARMEMVRIEPGTFWMGYPLSEGGNTDEARWHQVTISKEFYLGKYELTMGQWDSVMGTQPWLGQDNAIWEDFRPAAYISWNDMQDFIHRLNQAAGDSLYRLPTEAEWEYACRAEATTHWSFGDDETQLGNYAWYKDNTWALGVRTAQLIGNLQPNRWGLYDIYGNVWEWVQDWWGGYPSSDVVDPTGSETGSFRVIRGGSFNLDAGFTWSAFRTALPPEENYFNIGARLVRVEPKTTVVTPQSWGQAKKSSR